MSELEPPREFNNQKPFVIRAHHLDKFMQLLQRSDRWNSYPVSSPKVVAEQIESSAESNRTRYCPSIEDYYIDVLGTSSQTARRNTEQCQKIFETFLFLPENHPAEITEGIRDDICNACIIGEHCQMKFPDGKGYKWDRLYVNAFLKAINYTHSRKPSIAKEKVFFLDAKKPEEVRIVRTTVGTVKNVLTTKPFRTFDVLPSGFWERLKFRLS